MTDITLYHGVCLDILPTLDANSVDSIVTDPPYGISFMAKEWDHGIPGVRFWTEALRVAKPGAYLLAFGGTRTFHRLAVAIEDAGWEIRDTVMWVYGSGFPKSHNVSKAIYKAAGAEREIIDSYEREGRSAGILGNKVQITRNITAPATDAARQWDGWGTALKPAWEPIIVARKPLIGTVAENVLAYGTGAINVDACRVGTDGRPHIEKTGERSRGTSFDTCHSRALGTTTQGRWPANLIHDGSDEVTELFPVTTSGAMNGKYRNTLMANRPGVRDGKLVHLQQVASSGSAARYFYCAKASKRDRDEGCEELETVRRGAMVGNVNDGDFLTGAGNPRQSTGRNHHPTVKPTELMRYLCRLVTQPDGVILDPFMGSGSTGKAAILEGFNFIGIEIDADYFAIAQKRIAEAQMQPRLVEA